MKVKFIDRKLINLSNMQEKMIISGWGEKALTDSVVEKVIYSSDGLKVKGYIAYPVQKGKFPCLVWCRGGIGEAGAIDEFNARGMFGLMASWGYTVFAPQYRGNSGSEGYDEFGGQDINDIFNIMKLADQMEQVDNQIWGIEGWSRGGLMTYLMLTKTTIFKAAVILGGISNVNNAINSPLLIKRMQELKNPNKNIEEFNDIIKSRSVINFVDKISSTTPMLIIHGTKDERILVNDPIDLSYKLLKSDKKFRLVLLEDGDHYLKAHRKEVDEMRKKWYKKYLI